ncbi:hypothetical protein KKF91_20115 [Myxococcota bacterium]|nr:hypothetical protein [Myxococcota bacterium]MBU1432852.1 hypothetical protein [Myxococcota bacterium]MBU1897536.1 hypothetical protein [Myxococcota bacterium]
MEIKDAGYRVWYEPARQTIWFEGTLRLSTSEFTSISDLLEEVLALEPSELVLGMRGLRFLNSSGINTLYKFAIALRKRGGVQLVVQADSSVGWQTKSLPNLKRFLPGVRIEMG